MHSWGWWEWSAKVPVDKIVIQGLFCHARVGVTDEERRVRQRILIDLDLDVDLGPAGKSDRVEETVDYAAVAQESRRLAESKPFRLAEAVAEEVAAKLLQRFDLLQVRVKVRKFSVPGVESVGVEIIRQRRQGER